MSRLTLDDGSVRFLGLTPTPHALRATFPRFADANDLIPESGWREFEEQWPEGVAVKDQNGVGACNGHAAALGLELARHVEGFDPAALSAWWVYGNLARWPIDSGSNIGEALDLLEQTGCSTEALVAYKNWNRATFTAQAKAAAARFKVQRGQAVTTDEEFATAVQRRQPLNFAIPAGARLGNLDADGVSPLAPGFCNHAVTAWGGMKRSRSGVWLFKWVNSWGASWGRNGTAWLPLKGITRHAGFEAYVVQAASTDPNDPTPVPAPLA